MGQPSAPEPASVAREVERTLAAPDDWALPASPVAGLVAEDAGTVDLDALYLDTPDLRLLRRGVTLRRRGGGDDAGWHLKLPVGDDARDEVRRPLGPDDAPGPGQDPAPRPPEPLADLVAGLARGAPVLPVARLRTTRRVVLLHDGDGAPLVAVADDRVEAVRLADPADGTGPPASAWREVEVELLPAAADADDVAALLDRVVDALVDAGAATAPGAPKLLRALGLPTGWAPGRDEPPGPASSAGDVVTAAVREQVDALLLHDPAVRLDRPDAVHRARVATRRLRSVLGAFRPLLDRSVTEPVRAELRWWGRALGDARDAEVARDRVRAVLDATPDELVVGPVRARVVDELDAAYRDAWRGAVEQMQGERYLALLDALEALAAEPPLDGSAGEDARDVLPAFARRSWRRTRRRVRAADAATGERREALLHDVRKAAKRARYAAEAMVPALGAHAERFAARLEAVQDALGEHHDAVGLARALRALGMRANLSGENGFSYGLLVGAERERADDALEDYEAAWARARRPGYRRWTRS